MGGTFDASGRNLTAEEKGVLHGVVHNINQVPTSPQILTGDFDKIYPGWVDPSKAPAKAIVLKEVVTVTVTVAAAPTPTRRVVAATANSDLATMAALPPIKAILATAPHTPKAIPRLISVHNVTVADANSTSAAINDSTVSLHVNPPPSNISARNDTSAGLPNK